MYGIIGIVKHLRPKTQRFSESLPQGPARDRIPCEWARLQKLSVSHPKGSGDCLPVSL